MTSTDKDPKREQLVKKLRELSKVPFRPQGELYSLRISEAEKIADHILAKYTPKSQATAAQEEAKIEGALFALDNETLWQYQRKCNRGEATKATRVWLLGLIEDNIKKYKRRLASLHQGKDKESKDA